MTVLKFSRSNNIMMLNFHVLKGIASWRWFCITYTSVVINRQKTLCLEKESTVHRIYAKNKRLRSHVRYDCNIRLNVSTNSIKQKFVEIPSLYATFKRHAFLLIRLKLVWCAILQGVSNWIIVITSKNIFIFDCCYWPVFKTVFTDMVSSK